MDMSDTISLITETVRDDRLRRRIAYERSIGLAHVGVELDRVCRELGLDPVQVWRLPRAREEQDRRDQAALAYQWRAQAAVSSPSRFTLCTMPEGT